jgi:SpoVK/Ycf46/Vps4 family AAA+-type ATPase
VAKKWGEIPVSQLTEINFDDTAFDKLVLPAEKKKLISALVKFQDRAFTDIITGKGGGCIFLLHGSPGVGKTLTAESLAELMHKPLYSVTVGELGTTTDSLEENLSKVLELAATWKAVILLDEADIFLEERSKNDIARNAMVGIFLRLLEYHQGVLFLTTNRVKNFDPAFHSRISIALKYHDLDTDAREQIWTNLLSAAKIEGINPKEFSHYEINGRQIKNSIRLAQALAASEDLPVTKEFLLQTVGVARQFQTDLLESIVVREAHDAIVQQAIDESVKEEASKLRVSNELLRKSINLDEKK